MAVLAFQVTGKGLPRFTEAVKAVGSESRLHTVHRRALNHVGPKGFTQVKRALSRQVGLSQADTVKHGNMRVRRANKVRLTFEINATGGFLSLKRFGARQFSYGVRAKPWGRAQQFPGAFIFAGHPKSGKPVAGGHVFKRTGPSSTPIEKLWGPSIPKEMVKDESRAAFERNADALPGRVRHEIRRMTRGAVT